ncbi:MAG: UPF0158 family protein [Myxococcota bacterium]|nr:UPF0158 family protein [Myxococcota bacterium]
MLELTVDWLGLFSAFQMNMPELRCYFCLDDGRVLKLAAASEELEEVRKDSKRYVPIEIIASRIQYQWICDFTLNIEDENSRVRLEAAINGKGAFRRFKDILLTMPEERKHWFDFRDQKMRARIVDWVRERNIIALNPPPWSDEGVPDETDQPPVKEAILACLMSWAKDDDSTASLEDEALDKLSDKLVEKLDHYLNS